MSLLVHSPFSSPHSLLHPFIPTGVDSNQSPHSSRQRRESLLPYRIRRLMELWHSPRSLSAQIDYQSASRTHRALESTSGNVQPYGLDIKEGYENQNPIGSEVRDFSVEVKTGSLQPPVVTQNLGSAHHQVNLQRLQTRRQQPSTKIAAALNADRPYLRHPKYIQYKTRGRQDLGSDGKPIWDDEVEEAFQDGERNIQIFRSSLTHMSFDCDPSNGAEEEIPAWQNLWTESANSRVHNAPHAKAS
jgi:hypothetical protein